MKKLNLILGILCVLIGIVTALCGSMVGALCLLVIGAANIYIGLRKPKPVEPEPAQEPKKIRQELTAFTVAGYDYYQEALRSLLYEENPEYTYSKAEMVDMEDTRLYEYEPYTTAPRYVPEPDNEHDPGAIAILVDDVKIGYVPRKYQQDVNKYIDDDTVTHEVEIYGGRYKMARLGDEYDDINGPKISDYEIVRDSTPYKASVRIYTAL